MISLIQRVTRASVDVDGVAVGAIGPGLLALVAVERADDATTVARMARRLLAYRVFPDDRGRMHLALADTGGGLLLVSQFTLAADTSAGLRPDFGPAAPAAHAAILFSELHAACRALHPPGVESGRFGAHMTVSLVNDGPVTFLLRA